MYGIKEVGKYNIIFEGVSYDKGIPYEMVIIEKLKDSTRESRKTLFFRQNTGMERKYIMPKFEDEKEIEMLYNQYYHNTKIQIYRKIVIEEIN